MLPLLLSVLAGILVRFVVKWSISDSFDLKQQLKQVVPAVLIGGLVAVLFKVINFGGVLAWILLACAGFLTAYVVDFLSRKKI